jgi:hypothetical protein
MFITTDLTGTRRWRIADLTSGMGALVLGVGIGAFFASAFARTSGGTVTKTEKAEVEAAGRSTA